MNTTVLNYHLATARTADLERDARRIRARERAATSRRRDVATRGRGRRAALVARLIG